MSHSDDTGLVLPPLVAPLHVVIVPIFKSSEDLQEIKKYLSPLLTSLENMMLEVHSVFLDTSFSLSYKIDEDDQKSPGWKFAEWEMK